MQLCLRVECENNTLIDCNQHCVFQAEYSILVENQWKLVYLPINQTTFWMHSIFEIKLFGIICDILNVEF